MTSDARVARTAAATLANRQRRAIRLAADVVQRLTDLPKIEFAALAFAVVHEVERRGAAIRAADGSGAQ